MQQLNEFLQIIDSYIGGSQWFVLILLGTGLFFTVYLKFPQIKYLGFATKIVRGKFDREGTKGDTSHFQALTTALSATIGTGNIAGVALAIHLGGPGALFWMIVTAVFGMCLKFVEVSISHRYREFAPDGTVAGGPMYYMRNRLNMKWLAIIFAVATVICSFGTGNLPQINSISNSMFTTFGINQWITGIVLAFLLAMVIVFGIKRIALVTERLVPTMAIVYLIGAFAVIFYNYEQIIPAFVSIFRDVFTGTAAAGGFLGAGVSFAFNRGVNRGLFSNEAGQGSAAIAHSSARAPEPVSEGLVALLGPLIDTIIICTLTGLVLITSGTWNQKLDNTFQLADLQVMAKTYDESDKADIVLLRKHLNGIEAQEVFQGKLLLDKGKIQNTVSIIHARSLAENIEVLMNGEPFSGEIIVTDGYLTDVPLEMEIRGKSLIHSAPLTTIAFTKGFFGDFGRYIVSIGLLLFAFSTAISWSYYGDRAITFLFGIKYVMAYRLVYVVMFFLASFIDTTIVWTFSGIAIAFMTLPNLFGILMLHKEMKSEISEYWIRMRKAHPDEKLPG